MIRRLIVIFSIGFWLITPSAMAAGLIINASGTSCDNNGQNCAPNYTINDFFQQFIKLAWWGLGLMSILAVGMLIWAGVLFITAAGNSSRVEEGKKIITGTITGVIVSLSAFVIINTVVAGLTGTKLRVSDYFDGTIGTIFSSKSGKEAGLERPFSGLGTVDTDGSCQGSNNETWDKNCSEENLHIFCADPKGENNGLVQRYQLLLVDKNCNCLGSTAKYVLGNDGCYGGKTLACVRNFQIQNRLPPTGELDAATRAALNSSTSQRCNASFIDPIAKKLPGIQNTPPSGASTTTRGCCKVADTSGSSYCANGVTEVTCLSSGASSVFQAFDAKTTSCATSSTLRHSCGFCSNQPLGNQFTNNYGFQYATERWCKTISSPALTFTAGTCVGRGGLLSCKNTLLLTPEP